MMRGERFYKALLRCYPSAFRNEYGNQMLLMFTEQLDEARQSGGPREQAGLCMSAAWDVVTIAPKEHWHVMTQDIRYALRTMAARPGFTAVAILSLALGIGANTGIFSLWNGVLHSSLPGVSKPEQLVMLSNPNTAGLWHGNDTGDRSWLTYSEFEQLRKYATSFSDMMASQSSLDRWQVRFEGADWEEARGRLVSDGYFQFLGISARMGRVFTNEEGDSRGAVISYNYWQHRFGGSPDILNRTFTLRNAVLTVIGVAPPGFIGETPGQNPDLWIPARLQPSVVPGEDWLHETPPEKVMWLHVFGRLKPGVTPARAEAEANAIFKAGVESFYGVVGSPERRREYLDQRLKLRPGAHGASETRNDFSTSLTVLLGAVGLLLLIACANLANLLLARGAARKAEMALRLSLGASRGRLIRQLVTESLVLAVIGGLSGLAAAWFVHGALVAMIVQSDRNFQMGFALDPLVMAFTMIVTLGAGLLFGLLPAWQVTRTDAGTSLKEQSRSGNGSLGRMRWAQSLVSVQLALSLPLLAGAGLLARTVYNLQHVELGYPTRGLVLAGIDSRVAGYNSERSGILFRELLGRIQRIPGVSAASFSHNGVFTGTNTGGPIEVEGYTPKGSGDRSSGEEMVGAGYFSSLGIPILLGREILESDSATAPKVCVLNEAFAKKFFAGRNPIGMHVTPVDDERRTVYQVVGVAKDAHTSSLRDPVGTRFHIPIAQPHRDNVKRANFLIRTASPKMAVLSSVRREFQRVDPSLPIVYANSIEEQMAPSTAADRTTAQVAIVFGCIALALAAIGLYGVLAYGIARRQSEIAIRIALGAQPGNVIAMVFRETSGVVIAGLILGGGLTYAASRLIASQLFGVAPQDPITLALATGVLVVVALSAVYLPTRKASRLDPMAALRQE
jgi:predicted permease